MRHATLIVLSALCTTGCSIGFLSPEEQEDQDDVVIIEDREGDGQSGPDMPGSPAGDMPGSPVKGDMPGSPAGDMPGSLDMPGSPAEADMTPPPQPDMKPDTVCGDGVVEGMEVCDDGDTTGGDYCAADCGAVTGRCGDGIIQGNETCDDGAIQTGCATTHDGGDGTCVPADQCVMGYVLLGDGTCQPEVANVHVHIDVSNTCQMTVMPMQLEVPAGQYMRIEYHNHSQYYPVDVWGSYIGGYTDLQPGATWDDRYRYCGNINRPYTEYADISTACSNVRLNITCKQ